MSPRAARLYAALPQTQCTRCGYPDCAGYAQAIADDGAPINRCPPGGAEGIARLAALTGQGVVALNPANGQEAPRAVAVIDEAWCIGCTRCIDACPTDAILGANKFMHTVIERYCTGCELCLPACPVDCIAMENVTADRTGWQAWSQPRADEARQRYESRRVRLARSAAAQSGRGGREQPAREAATGDFPAIAGAGQPDHKKSTIAAALARARSRRNP